MKQVGSANKLLTDMHYAFFFCHSHQLHTDNFIPLVELLLHQQVSGESGPQNKG